MHGLASSKYKTTLITTTSFALTGGWKRLVDLRGTYGYFDLAPAADNTKVSVIITPYGTGADDSTFDFKIFGVLPLAGDEEGEAVQLYVATATLSTAVGLSGNSIDENTRFADTIASVTEGSFATAMEGAFGLNIETHTPTGNLPGHVVIGFTGGIAGLVFDVDLTGATGAGFLVKSNVSGG